MSHPGTYVNAPTLGVTGLVPGDPNTAVAFDPASDQYAIQDDTLAPQSFTALTIGCIVKPVTTGDANVPTVWGFQGNTFDNIYLEQQADGTILFWGSDGVGGIDEFGVLSATVLSAGTTYRIIGIWDGSVAGLYIDGALDASVAYTDAIVTAETNQFIAATNQFFTTGNQSFDGTLDEVFFVANHAATAPEIAAIDAAMTGTGDIETEINALSPYIYWRLGEASGTVANDSAGASPPAPVPPVLGALSDEQIIELTFGGQRQDRFTFPLLNPDRSPLGASLDAHADSAPSVQVQTQRTSFRTCSGLIVDDPPDDLDLSRVRVQPTLTLANGSQYPLGVLMFGLDARNIYAAGEQWTPELFDETFLLDQDLADTWSIGAGGSVLGLFVALADEVLGPLGIPADYEIDDVAAASPLVFKVGTSRNAALVALSALLGALPPFFDNHGTYRLKPAPQGLASDHSYEIGTRIFDASTVVSSSVYKAPNRYIVVGDDVGGTPVRGVYDLPDAAGNSFASTGQRVTAPAHTVSGVKSAELAQQIAYVDALTDQTTYGTAAFAAAADPRHDIFDTVTLLGVQYMETGWTLGCSAGSDHSHNLARMWA